MHFEPRTTEIQITKMKKDAKMAVLHSLLNRKIISRNQFTKEQNTILCEYSAKIDAILKVGDKND